MDLVQEPGDIPSKAEIRSYFDPSEGTLDRCVFADQSLYDLEMKNIYARAWNFMCHESHIPNPGDYFINYIGEDQVIVVRDKQGEVQVLLNTCRHLGGSIPTEGEKQDFIGRTNATLDQIGGLGHNDAGLARSCPGQNKRGILIGDDSKTLFGGERVFLDSIEERAHRREIAGDKALDCRTARLLGVVVEGAHRLDQPVLVL